MKDEEFEAQFNRYQPCFYVNSFLMYSFLMFGNTMYIRIVGNGKRPTKFSVIRTFEDNSVASYKKKCS